MATCLSWYLVVSLWCLVAAVPLNDFTPGRLATSVFRQRLREYFGCSPCEVALCASVPEKCQETVLEIGVCAGNIDRKSAGKKWSVSVGVLSVSICLETLLEIGVCACCKVCAPNFNPEECLRCAHPGDKHTLDDTGVPPGVPVKARAENWSVYLLQCVYNKFKPRGVHLVCTPC